MNIMKHKWSGYTYIKYILSYLIIVTTLSLGFYFIMKNLLMERFTDQRSKQVLQQLDSISEQLVVDINHLTEACSSLKSNTVLITSTQAVTSSQKYHTYRELTQYSACTQLIKSITYKFPNSEKIVSTRYDITYSEGKFFITSANSGTVSFDPIPWQNSTIGQLVYVSNDVAGYLIYVPSGSSLDQDFLFFVLDTDYIQLKLQSIRSTEVPAIALLDEKRQLTASVNGRKLLSYMDSFSLQDGIYQADDSTLICVHNNVYNNFSLMALISTDLLSSQINATFASSYLALLLLSGISLLLVSLSMRITYVPLNKLTRKLVLDANEITVGKDHLQQLESVFTQTKRQNYILAERLDNYRLFMQKSLLGTLVAAQTSDEINTSPDIDQFFDMETNKKIFIIHIMSPNEPLPLRDIQTYFQEVLPGNEPCIIFEAKDNSATFLINYVGMEQNKEGVLIELLKHCYQEKGYLSAISNASDSPLDIPSLYENVMRASSYWPDVTVVDYKSLPPVSAIFTYPSAMLKQLSELLLEKNFSEAKALVGNIFRVINNSHTSEHNIPDFFVHSILVDMLTNIANCMNKANINYDAYENLYTDTLYFCRSCPYAQKAGEIESNIYHLIDIHAQEIKNMALTPAQVIQLMEESYSDPDFSIALAADKCHVNVAAMSYLIKKELHLNFSDYLWTLRLKKAKELLISSDMSIDEVSVAVGYLNSSSFRRKFKQETGLTPSQFRAQKEK